MVLVRYSVPDSPCRSLMQIMFIRKFLTAGFNAKSSDHLLGDESRIGGVGEMFIKPTPNRSTSQIIY